MCIVQNTLQVGYTNFGLFLPLHLVTGLGLPPTLAASYVSVFALGDLVGRLTGPALSDRLPPRWAWYCGGLAGAGAALLLLAAMQSWLLVAGLTGIAGLASGVMVGVYPALLSDELGPDNLALTYPLSQTVAGLLNLAGPPLLALLATRLTTTAVMAFLGASLIVGATPLFIASLVMGRSSTQQLNIVMN